MKKKKINFQKFSGSTIKIKKLITQLITKNGIRNRRNRENRNLPKR